MRREHPAGRTRANWRAAAVIGLAVAILGTCRSAEARSRRAQASKVVSQVDRSYEALHDLLAQGWLSDDPALYSKPFLNRRDFARITWGLVESVRHEAAGAAIERWQPPAEPPPGPPGVSPQELAALRKLPPAPDGRTRRDLGQLLNEFAPELREMRAPLHEERRAVDALPAEPLKLLSPVAHRTGERNPVVPSEPVPLSHWAYDALSELLMYGVGADLPEWGFGHRELTRRWFAAATWRLLEEARHNSTRAMIARWDPPERELPAGTPRRAWVVGDRAKELKAADATIRCLARLLYEFMPEMRQLGAPVDEQSRFLKRLPGLVRDLEAPPPVRSTP